MPPDNNKPQQFFNVPTKHPNTSGLPSAMRINREMLPVKYLTRYAGDWAVVALCQLYVLTVGLRTQPFLREFNIMDPTIQHPFTQHEQVTDWQCLLLTTVIPGSIIAVSVLSRIQFNLNRLTHKEVHFAHISMLALMLSVTLTGFITVIVKNWISRPRPDFLARCQLDPLKLVEGKTTYGIEICTGELSVIWEGLRSTPSGHSSLAFSGLHFVTIWMFYQFDVFASQFQVWKLLVCSLPEWVAVWVALSRTQDYRHHFGDIFLGGLLGITIAHLIWKKMFVGKEPVYLQDSEQQTLPLYSSVDD